MFIFSILLIVFSSSAHAAFNQKSITPLDHKKLSHTYLAHREPGISKFFRNGLAAGVESDLLGLIGYSPKTQLGLNFLLKGNMNASGGGLRSLKDAIQNQENFDNIHASTIQYMLDNPCITKAAFAHAGKRTYFNVIQAQLEFLKKCDGKASYSFIIPAPKKNSYFVVWKHPLIQEFHIKTCGKQCGDFCIQNGSYKSPHALKDAEKGGDSFVHEMLYRMEHKNQDLIRGVLSKYFVYALEAKLKNIKGELTKEKKSLSIEHSLVEGMAERVYIANKFPGLDKSPIISGLAVNLEEKSRILLEEIKLFQNAIKDKKSTIKNAPCFQFNTDTEIDVENYKNVIREDLAGTSDALGLSILPGTSLLIHLCAMTDNCHEVLRKK